MGSIIKQHLVLDYNLWQTMASLQIRIKTPLIWGKVDLHIDTNTYKEGNKFNGDQYSIQLNTILDEWVTVARRSEVGGSRQYFYPESGVMVQSPDKGFVYGDICRWLAEEINQHTMTESLCDKNRHWTESI